jgi:hypothetical protein
MIAIAIRNISLVFIQILLRSGARPMAQRAQRRHCPENQHTPQMQTTLGYSLADSTIAPEALS